MIGRVTSFAALVFAVVILYGMQRTTPIYSEIISPVPAYGVQGKRVDTDAFAVGVAKMTLARRITASSFTSDRIYTTSGVWVIIEAAAEAKQKSITLTSAQWLGKDGTRYRLTQRLSAAPGLIGNERLEPGLPRPILMVFEVPESQLAGGALLIAQTALTPLAQEARVDMADVNPSAIKQNVVLKRGSRLLPWVLESN